MFSYKLHEEIYREGSKSDRSGSGRPRLLLVRKYSDHQTRRTP